MPKAKYNQFTRGILLAFFVLALSVVLYMGKLFALNPSIPNALAHIQPLPSLQADGLQRVVVLPRAVTLRSGLPKAAMTLIHYNVDTRIRGNVAVTTITKTYRIATVQPQAGHLWFTSHVRRHLPVVTFSVNGKPVLGHSVLPAKTG